MTPAASLLLGGLCALLIGAALLAMVRHERAQRGKWNTPDWWKRPVNGPGLRLSVRPLGDPASAEVTSISDPRVVTATVRATTSKRRARKVRP